MQARYRYRIEPTEAQRAVFARTFGCVRVVARKQRTLARLERETCSACGAVRAELPLKVREWACCCGAVHDRDHNAAINILAAGRAERQNACGASVSPPCGEAAGEEAGSTPGAA